MKKSDFLKIITTVFICLGIISCSYSATYTTEDLVDGVDGGYSVLIQENSDEIIVTPVCDEGTETGFIFYPGALVSYDAYLPLMTRLASNGIKCIIVNMPADMAFTDINAANQYVKKYSKEGITDWYISGHSLGGAMAATYVSSNASKFKGLVLLAAYSTKDLTDSGLKVLSIYGSNDEVLNQESYAKYKSNLPSDFTEYVIEGGNHANYANYGEQKGDGEATITRSEQQDETADVICKFIFN